MSSFLTRQVICRRHVSANATCGLSGQVFLHHQRVHAVGIVPRPGPDHVVAVPLVERQGPEVVYRGFQALGALSLGTEAIFRSPQQQRSNARAAFPPNYINGDDMSGRAIVHHDEACNFAFDGVRGDQCERSSPAYIGLEFLLRIRNSRREAFLVHPPERFEVFGLEVADDEGHADIVAGESADLAVRAWFSTAYPGAISKKMWLRSIVLLPGSQPRTYHRHQRTG